MLQETYIEFNDQTTFLLDTKIKTKKTHHRIDTLGI